MGLETPPQTPPFEMRWFGEADSARSAGQGEVSGMPSYCHRLLIIHLSPIPGANATTAPIDKLQGR